MRWVIRAYAQAVGEAAGFWHIGLQRLPHHADLLGDPGCGDIWSMPLPA
jgi:hypothetical protein